MLKIYPKDILLGALLWFLSFSMFSQTPGCPNVNAGPDVDLDCTEDCVELTASYLETGATTSYRVDPIRPTPPFPFTGGTNSVPLTQDDHWSHIIDLGFDFCFFGDTYDKALISTNGAITFSIQGEVPNGRYSPNTSAGFPIKGLVPGNDGTFSGISSDARALLGIFGVLQDTYPPQSFPDWSINYELIGEAPCRMLVFNMYK